MHLVRLEVEMSDYSVSSHHGDILFEKRVNDPSDDVWLADALNSLVAHVENNMCEANAKEVYEVACILEMKAQELRDIYNFWRRRNFEKCDSTK